MLGTLLMLEHRSHLYHTRGNILKNMVVKLVGIFGFRHSAMWHNGNWNSGKFWNSDLGTGNQNVIKSIFQKPEFL